MTLCLSFLSSQKKQKQTKKDHLKVTQFKTENLCHIHDMSSELFNHFDIVPICSNFHRHLSSTCFHYSNCNHMHSYDCLFLIRLEPILFSFSLKSTFNFHSLLLPKVFVVVFNTCMCTISIKSTVITCTLM